MDMFMQQEQSINKKPDQFLLAQIIDYGRGLLGGF